MIKSPSGFKIPTVLWAVLRKLRSVKYLEGLSECDISIHRLLASPDPPLPHAAYTMIFRSWPLHNGSVTGILYSRNISFTSLCMSAMQFKSDGRLER